MWLVWARAEACESIGGGARSAELTDPGFVHDVCSAVHPLAVASPFLCTLPLTEHGFEWATLRRRWLIRSTMGLPHCSSDTTRTWSAATLARRQGPAATLLPPHGEPHALCEGHDFSTLFVVDASGGVPFTALYEFHVVRAVRAREQC